MPNKKPKKISINLPLILGAVFAVAATFYMAIKENFSSDQVTPTLSATQSMVSSPQPTFPEKEFINEKYGYSFKYTDYGADSFFPKPTLSEDLVNISGPDSIVLKIEPLATAEVDPEKWWAGQTIEPTQNKPTSCFSTKLVTEVKSSYDPSKVITTFEQPALSIELKNTPDCIDPSDYILIVPHQGKLFKLTYDFALESEKILSTLKWF